MTRRVLTRPFLAALLAAAPAPALAQLGEVQLGAVASWGSAKTYGPGGGLVFGVAAGRLAYVGVRWSTFAGSTAASATPAADVRTRVQLFAADVGLQFPAGPFETIPRVSVGVARFTQHADYPGVFPADSTAHAHELLVAPALAVQMYVAGLAVIPELQYVLSGSPDLRWPVQHRGLLLSLRLVVPIEVRRIRR